MKREIRQNGRTVLHSGDGHSIPMIFNNLVGKNLKGREYSDYIAFVAIPDMGFTYGKIAYYSDGNLIATGGNHAITSPPLCFIAGSPGRVAIRPDFFLPARGKGLTRFSDALLFLSVSRGREKRKKQKETL